MGRRLVRKHIFFHTQKFYFIIFLLLIFLNVYLFLRETQSMSGGRAESEGDTESEAGSRL